MKPTFPLTSLFLFPLLGAICFVANAAHAAVLYSETFTAASNQTLTAWGGGWSGYAGSSATDVTSVAAGSVDSVSVGFLNTTPTTSWLSVNNNAAAVSRTFAAITTFSSINVANGSTITWNMGNANVNNTVRLLVQVGGSWYASSSTFTTNPGIATATTFASELLAGTAPLETLVFNTSASNWLSFTLTSGSSMVLGGAAAADLSSNAITGIGFYVVSAAAKGQVTRIDNLMITAVPEPSTSAMLLLGLVAMGVAARRRPIGERGLRLSEK
jgi:hypothetical protein